MEQILAAKRALTTVDVVTQAAELMNPSAQKALDLAMYKVLGANSDEEVLVALAKRADAVTEFNPLVERIDQLETMIIMLTRRIDNSADTSELLEQANKLVWGGS